MNTLGIKTTFIEYTDWNNFIQSVYNKPYDLLQQVDSESTIITMSVPGNVDNTKINKDIPENIDENELRCVELETWLNKDPQEENPNFKYKSHQTHWWKRYFYPDIQAIANDLYEKGLLEEGNYTIYVYAGIYKNLFW